MKRCKSAHIDGPNISAEAQPVEMLTVPSQWGGRLRRTRALNVWMPMATIKKNEAYSPICFNDPKRRQSSNNLRADEQRTVHDTLSAARCPYEITRSRSASPLNRATIEAILLTSSDPTSLDPIDIYHSAHSPNPVAKQ